MSRTEPIDVVVRCRNEMPFTERTLRALASQSVVHRVTFMDCGSTDGSREVAVAAGVSILDVDPKRYVPGVVLNRGMEATGSSIVAFVNADAIPCDDEALARLVAPLVEAPHLVATFGRQVARPDADPAVRLEYARAFGDVAPRLRQGTFFSMAASALRRDAWARLRFDETLRYSEDVDFVRRAEAAGFALTYVPDARFEHSHDYSFAEHRKRRAGEGEADSRIHHLGGPSLVSDLLRPAAGAVLRDLRAGLWSPRVLGVRAMQALGYFEGRRRASAHGSAR
jgi:rhamnosyltransferase